MTTMGLAWINVKHKFKLYLLLVISLAFNVAIIYNFQQLIFSDALNILGEMNKSYITIIIQILSIVLYLFMFFFISYSLNTFLTHQKKEIGIYTSMGMTNRKIGKLYLLEISIIGLISLLGGLLLGVITTKLFQMIIVKLSDISVVIKFQVSFTPILRTVVTFIVIYMIHCIKGYIDIVRSNIIDIISYNKQNEYVRTPKKILIIKSILGICILLSGYYLAIRETGLNVMTNLVAAVILVCIGVYLIFGGFVPLTVQTLAQNKNFLYKKERCLWINSIIFRIRKNYRTYAIASIMMISAVTVLSTSFAMKLKYDSIKEFRNVYSLQVISDEPSTNNQIKDIIEKSDNNIKYSSSLEMTVIDNELVENVQYESLGYAITSSSELKKLADDISMEFDIEEFSSDEYVELERLHLMSFAEKKDNLEVRLNGKNYSGIGLVVPYLGKIQENIKVFVLSDDEYKRISNIGEKINLYSYNVENPTKLKDSLSSIEKIINEKSSGMTSYNYIDPNLTDIDWIKVTYSISAFLFLVFILASCSVLFVKIYNDSYEEKHRYRVLNKIGISKKAIHKSIRNEMRMTFGLPFMITLISSYFSTKSLSNLMEQDLIIVNIGTILCILVIYYICYRISIVRFKKNAEINGGFDNRF